MLDQYAIVMLDFQAVTASSFHALERTQQILMFALDMENAWVPNSVNVIQDMVANNASIFHALVLCKTVPLLVQEKENVLGQIHVNAPQVTMVLPVEHYFVMAYQQQTELVLVEVCVIWVFANVIQDSTEKIVNWQLVSVLTPITHLFVLEMVTVQTIISANAIRDTPL